MYWFRVAWLFQEGLEKYLIKSLCTDLVNSAFAHIASEQDIQGISSDLNADQRMKLLGQFPKETSEHLLPIHKALASNR